MLKGTSIQRDKEVSFLQKHERSHREGVGKGQESDRGKKKEEMMTAN